MWLTDLSPRLRRLGPVLLGSAALAACASTGGSEKSALENARTPTEQYAITVEQTPDRLALAPHATGLSQAQRAALIGFVSRWRDAAEAGDIIIQAPSGGDAAATSRTVSEVMGALQVLGAPSQRVRNADYDPAAAAGAPPAPVLVSYLHLEARGPGDCAERWDQFTSTGSNRPTENFGCAITSNIAAQVADPRDFLGPAGLGAPDAGRRDTVIGKYRQGLVTSTAADEQARGAVSGVIR